MASFARFLTDTQSALFRRATVSAGQRRFSTYTPSTVVVSGVIPQRIEGASPMYKKNVAAKVPFKAVDASNTGATLLTITAKTGKDGANPTTTSNAVVESGQGWYYITLTATEMNGEIVVLDLSCATATIAPIAIHTEADYTVARAADLDNLDATVSSRSTYAGGAVASVAAAVTVGTNNDKTGYALTAGYDPAKTAAQAGDAMALTSGERTTLAAVIWNALTSGMTTVGSIGKKIADWAIGTTQTGDSYARIGAAGAGLTALGDSRIANLDAAVSTRLASASYTAPPSAATNATAVRTELGTELGRIDAATTTRLASGTVASDVTAIKAKTDNLPSDPADASDIAGAFSTVNSTLATIAGYVDTEVAAIKAKTDLIPASPAAVSDIPSAAANASATRTELAVELGRIDVAVSSVSGGGGGLDAAGVRAAVGLASANLDDQLAALPTATENADILLNRDMSAVSDTNDRTPLNALRFLRNKWSLSGAATLSVKKEDDTTDAWTAAVTTSAGAEPISGSTPT